MAALTRTYLLDRMKGKFQLASVTSSGKKANAACWTPDISGNGKYVVFATNATNLGKDKDSKYDVFIHRRK